MPTRKQRTIDIHHDNCESGPDSKCPRRIKERTIDVPGGISRDEVWRRQDPTERRLDGPVRGGNLHSHEPTAIEQSLAITVQAP